MDMMGRHLNRVDLTGKRVLDIGSLDLNGNYRGLIEGRGGDYAGLDLVGGQNVDVIARGSYDYPIDSGSLDVAISGSVMEHVEAPWLWVPELARMLRPAGFLAIVTHWQWEIHRFPVDCWRFLPDGMNYLLEPDFDRIEITLDDDGTIAASAFRR